ncbi:hypothetical protein [Nocardia cyriacigeorgica]|uniref:hypothetical protein n=1 Tax=Nocardia cyriacigeorgica TaxID=135487 RepID=UPI0018941641|nr:hypothetical protein [Nocardia cyriacigeorgica]MBF6412932.1 hypothetical protein [Nocardia cyriacigeorgica]
MPLGRPDLAFSESEQVSILLFQGGIFSGMNSYPVPEDVRNELGDEFLAAFVSSVEGSSADLRELRMFQPDWYADYSKRFVANFIHERVWSRMVASVRSHEGVNVVDQEPKRQIHYGIRYEIRFKRHKPGAAIASYPTKGAMAFWTQAAYLPGLEKISLALGYMWDAELNAIDGAVMSFRDGTDNPIWLVKLGGSQAGSGTEITFAPIDPMLPTIDLSGILSEPATAADGT